MDDVGFALLFPTAEAALPSLYEAASQQPLPLSEMGWGPDEQRVWEWKDELPRKGGWPWSGRLLRGGRASFLAPGLLVDCYPRVGAPDDFRRGTLGGGGPPGRRDVACQRPLPTAVLRQAVGLDGRRGGARFAAAVAELGRALVCTSYGTEQVDAGWPSAVLELTARAVDIGGREADEAARRRRVARRFLATMLMASASELASGFGWPRAAAGAALEELVDRGRWWGRRAPTGPARSAAHAQDHNRRSRGRA